MRKSHGDLEIVRNPFISVQSFLEFMFNLSISMSHCVFFHIFWIKWTCNMYINKWSMGFSSTEEWKTVLHPRHRMRAVAKVDDAPATAKSLREKLGPQHAEHVRRTEKRTGTHLESFDPLGSLDIMLDVKLQSRIDIASAPDGSVLLCRWTRKRNGQIDWPNNSTWTAQACGYMFFIAWDDGAPNQLSPWEARPWWSPGAQWLAEGHLVFMDEDCDFVVRKCGKDFLAPKTKRRLSSFIMV